jgi:hypothetical protein
MATRQQRLSQFNDGMPPQVDDPVQLLCEDHNGTYVLPYLCHWRDDAWHNSASSEVIIVKVVGWRVPISSNKIRR